MTRRGYSSTAEDNTISAGIDATQTTVTMTSALVGYPGTYPFTCVIDEGTATEELVQVTGAPSGLTYPIARGQDGTAGEAHSSGATFGHRASARDLDEPNAHIASSTNVHGLAVGDSVAGRDALALKADDSATVHNTGNETIAGVKTFSSAPVVPDGSFAEAKVSGLVSALSTLTTAAAAAQSTADSAASDASSAVTTANAASSTASSASTAAAAAQSTADDATTALESRPTISQPQGSFTPSPPTTDLMIKSGEQTVTTSASGGSNITFDDAFPNGIANVVICLADTSPPGGSVSLINGGATTSGFTFRVYSDFNATYNSQTVRVSWIAVGW